MSSEKTTNKMEGRRQEGHFKDAGNARIGKMSRRKRREKASSEGGQGREGAVMPFDPTEEILQIRRISSSLQIKSHYYLRI
jgi:hypothetical protein